MMQTPIPAVDDALRDVPEGLTREHGHSDLEWLAARTRKERRDAMIDTEAAPKSSPSPRCSCDVLTAR